MIETQVVHGIHLPVWDTHFRAQIEKNPIIDGKGTYQHSKLVQALALTHRRRHAVDVGAHVGLWSRVLASSTFDRLTAFEPVPEHADCFDLNLADRTNVTLYRCALGDRVGMVRLSNIAGDIASARVDDGGLVVAELRPLDSFGLVDVDFVKIDAEGYDVPIIMGGEETIRRDKPVIIVEQKGRSERYGDGKFASVELLKSWGAHVALKMKGDFALVWDETN